METLQIKGEAKICFEDRKTLGEYFVIVVVVCVRVCLYLISYNSVPGCIKH